MGEHLRRDMKQNMDETQKRLRALDKQCATLRFEMESAGLAGEVGHTESGHDTMTELTETMPSANLTAQSFMSRFTGSLTCEHPSDSGRKPTLGAPTTQVIHATQVIGRDLVKLKGIA